MKIAVIDDERPARKELVHQIMDAMPDSQIEEADSGASAIELISGRTFDLLFVDISLGDMDGTTLAAAARRILPDAQIVFATAYSQYGVKAFELGVNNYILKPFDPDRVRRVLEKCQRTCRKTRPLPLLLSAPATITSPGASPTGRLHPLHTPPSRRRESLSQPPFHPAVCPLI